MAGQHEQANEDKALAAFFRGDSYASIRDREGFSTIMGTQAAILRALRRARARQSADVVRLEEVARLEAMAERIYEGIQSGQIEDADRYLRVVEQKMRLVDYEPQGPSTLTAAYEHTLDALRKEGKLKDEDEAIIQSGETLARQIDFILAHGTHRETARMLSMLPQLTAILVQLGATPEARRKIQQTARELEKVPRTPWPSSAPKLSAKAAHTRLNHSRR